MDWKIASLYSGSKNCETKCTKCKRTLEGSWFFQENIGKERTVVQKRHWWSESKHRVKETRWYSGRSICGVCIIDFVLGTK